MKDRETALAEALAQIERGCKDLPDEPRDIATELAMHLFTQNQELRSALAKAYGRWMLGCDPSNDFPDWPDDPASVMNDLWKDGWPKQARQALAA